MKDESPLLPIRLSLILGLHPEIEDLLTELSAPPLRQAPDRAVKRDDLIHQIELHPIRVMRVSGRWRCTGNIRLYQTAQRLLVGDTQVLCIADAGMTTRQLSQRVLAELLQTPPLVGVHFSDVPLLFQMYLRAIERKRIDPPDKALDLHFAELYGVDRRRLKMPKSAEDVATSLDGDEDSNTAMDAEAAADTSGKESPEPSIDLPKPQSPQIGHLSVKELRRQLPQSNDDLAVEVRRHGRVVGYYLPCVHPIVDQHLKAHRTAAETLAHALTAARLSLDSISTGSMERG